MCKIKAEDLCPQYYTQLQLEVALAPMSFIDMDLIGKLKVLSEGHQYVLTVTNKLMNYVCA